MPGSYGTVMIARIAVPFEEVQAAVARWVAERHVPGFQHEDILLADDGRTVVMSVFFDDEASYKALADDPVQAEWWEGLMSPMIDGEVQWIDGHWRVALDA
jgi:hypothetical protein